MSGFHESVSSRNAEVRELNMFLISTITLLLLEFD